MISLVFTSYGLRMELTSRQQALRDGLKRYYTGKSCKHGHYAERIIGNGTCVECIAAYQRLWYKKNPEKIKASAAKWRQANRERVRRLERERRRRKVGMPAPTRPDPGICENCEQSGDRSLALDHCHRTGKFRGWLCFKCNAAIGALGDNIEGLQRAIDYLRKNE